MVFKMMYGASSNRKSIAVVAAAVVMMTSLTTLMTMTDPANAIDNDDYVGTRQCPLPDCAKGRPENLKRYRATLRFPEFPYNNKTKWVVGSTADNTTCFPHAFDSPIKPSDNNPFFIETEVVHNDAGQPELHGHYKFKAFGDTLIEVLTTRIDGTSPPIFTDPVVRFVPGSFAAQQCQLIDMVAFQGTDRNCTTASAADDANLPICANTDTQTTPINMMGDRPFQFEVILQCCDLCPGSPLLQSLAKDEDVREKNPILCPVDKQACAAHTERIDGVVSAREVSTSDLLVDLQASTEFGTPRIALASQQECLRRISALSVVSYFREECFWRPTRFSTRNQVRLWHSWRCAAARAAAPHLYARAFEVGIDAKSALWAMPHATKKLDSCHLPSWKPGANKHIQPGGEPDKGYGRVAIDVGQLLAELVCGVQGLTTIARDLAEDVASLKKKYKSIKSGLTAGAALALTTSGFGVVADGATRGLAYGKSAGEGDGNGGGNDQ